MEKEFVTYEQALALKELGFNEPCFGYYYHENSFTRCRPQIYYSDTFTECNPFEEIPLDSCKSPLYQQAFRWFREKHNFCSCITPSSEKITIKYEYGIFEDGYLNLREIKGGFKTYEEAELECLKKLIEIVNNK